MQQIPFVAAAIKAGTSFGILDELELARLDLQGVHILLGVDLTGVEPENWCVGMENSGFVNSRMDGIRKSSMF